MNATQEASPVVGGAGWLAADLQQDTTWIACYGAVETGVVRGGSFGQPYTQACRDFDEAQAGAPGMRLPA